MKQLATCPYRIPPTSPHKHVHRTTISALHLGSYSKVNPPTSRDVDPSSPRGAISTSKAEDTPHVLTWQSTNPLQDLSHGTGCGSTTAYKPQSHCIPYIHHMHTWFMKKSRLSAAAVPLRRVTAVTRMTAERRRTASMYSRCVNAEINTTVAWTSMALPLHHDHMSLE